MVTSFVSEILLPPISLLPFMNKNLEEKFAVLRQGNHYNRTIVHGGYNTLKQAMDDGAVVLAYGYVPSFRDQRLCQGSSELIIEIEHSLIKSSISWGLG